MRRKTILSRITVTVCVPMAGVGGTERPLPDGTRFLAISGILVFALVSSWRRGYCGRFFDWHHGLRHCFVVAREGVSVDSPKVTVSCRLGAYSLYFGYSTTERVLSSVCEPWGSLSLKNTTNLYRGAPPIRYVSRVPRTVDKAGRQEVVHLSLIHI